MEKGTEEGELRRTSAFRAEASLSELREKARILRRYVIQSITKAKSGHPGGSLSAAEIVTALYFKVMRHDPKNPWWEDRDRFILSKGHAAPLLYAALAECGYFPVSDLWTLRKFGSHLQGHTHRLSTPGVEMSAGSLGQGLSFAVGVALAGKLDHKDYRVYVLLGDGECDEGQIWEAAMAASHFKLDNLTAIVDYNKQQIDGWTCDLDRLPPKLAERYRAFREYPCVMNIEPLAEKWRAFGWRVFEVDGHSFEELLDAFEKIKDVKEQPSVIIAHTVKGKGVDFMENNPEFHGKAPTEEECERALRQL